MSSYDPTIWDNNDVQRLLLATVMSENKEQAKIVLGDLLTVSEVNELSKRLHIAYLLRKGKSYDQVRDITNASTTTIASISKRMRIGSGGYEFILKRIEEVFQDHFSQSQ
jgi:TrpR-related protein YerC/YecD